MSQEARIEIGPENIVLREDSRIIYHPRYLDEEKSAIKAIVRFPDGSLRELEAAVDDDDSPLIRDVFLQYSTAEIEMHTHRESCLARSFRELESRAQEDQRRQAQMARLFEAKTEVLQIEAVKDCADRNLARQIRSAKTVAEVHSLAAYALLLQRQAQA